MWTSVSLPADYMQAFPSFPRCEPAATHIPNEAHPKQAENQCGQQAVNRIKGLRGRSGRADTRICIHTISKIPIPSHSPPPDSCVSTTTCRSADTVSRQLVKLARRVPGSHSTPLKALQQPERGVCYSRALLVEHGEIACRFDGRRPRTKALAPEAVLCRCGSARVDRDLCAADFHCQTPRIGQRCGSPTSVRLAAL